MKAKELVEILSKNPDLELGNVEVRQTLFNKKVEEKKEIMLNFVNTFGRFEKKLLDESQIYLKHTRPGLEIILWEYDRCKIVGHIVKKRIIEKPIVPVEMVRFEEEYTVPVSDCQIENGEVQAKDVVSDPDPQNLGGNA